MEAPVVPLGTRRAREASVWGWPTMGVQYTLSRVWGATRVKKLEIKKIQPNIKGLRCPTIIKSRGSAEGVQIGCALD